MLRVSRDIRFPSAKTSYIQINKKKLTKNYPIKNLGKKQLIVIILQLSFFKEIQITAEFIINKVKSTFDFWSPNTMSKIPLIMIHLHHDTKINNEDIESPLTKS